MTDRDKASFEAAGLNSGDAIAERLHQPGGAFAPTPDQDAAPAHETGELCAFHASDPLEHLGRVVATALEKNGRIDISITISPN